MKELDDIGKDETQEQKLWDLSMKLCGLTEGVQEKIQVDAEKSQESSEQNGEEKVEADKKDE